MLIKSIYTLFLALLVALFVGLGIDSFYHNPEYPKYPSPAPIKQVGCEQNIEQQKIDETFTQLQDKYTKELKQYNQNVSLTSLIASIVILIISLTFIAKIKMIADGILLGGVFTTMYSIIRGFMGDNSQFRFLIVTIGLIIALVLGYIKFIKTQKNP